MDKTKTNINKEIKVAIQEENGKKEQVCVCEGGGVMLKKKMYNYFQSVLHSPSLRASVSTCLCLFVFPSPLSRALGREEDAGDGRKRGKNPHVR